MPLARYQFTVVDDAGNVLPAASVEVRREAAGSPIASIFSDREGATPLGNPFVADGDGYAAFHAAGGAYRITASKNGFSREWRYVGIGLAQEADAVTAGTAFIFDSATTDEDPGDGQLRLDNAALASVTTVYVDNANADGADVSVWLDYFDDNGSSGDRGILSIASPDSGALFVAQVTGSVVDGTGYRKLTVTPLVTSGSFTDGGRVYVQFTGAGTDGADGTTAGLTFNFDSSTSMADPGAGDFRLNNATLASVTAAAVDDQSAASGNPDVSAIVLSWDDATSSVRGYLTIKSVAAPQNFAVYSITGASTDNAGWTQLALTHIASSGSFTNGAPCSLEFQRTGDAGTVVGLQSHWIPASAMTQEGSQAAAFGNHAATATRIIQTLDFDQTTREDAGVWLAMPKSWNEGTFTFIPYWTAAGGTPGATVRWSMAAIAASNDDALDAAIGTDQVSDDVLLATNDLHIGPESSAITIGGTPAENDLVFFRIFRDPANDNLAADARLIGVKINITLNANTDA